MGHLQRMDRATSARYQTCQVRDPPGAYTDGTWTYTYDANGNLTKKTMGLSSTTWTYGYDVKNELTQAQEWTKDPTNGGSVELEEDFKYDVFGSLIETDSTVGSTTT